MAIIGDALRQGFMPKHEYESLRDDEKAWHKLRKPFMLLTLSLISGAILVSTIISLKIVFANDKLRRPFSREYQIRPLTINFTEASSSGRESARLRRAFVLTDPEIADYYWTVIFIPSAMVFLASVVYLIAGITVAYAAPSRHGCLKVVENNYCASRRGGVCCLSIINIVFAIIFCLLALFLGLTLLALASPCSLPLFWCYEISSWGLVILYGGTAFCLRRKAAVVVDVGDSSSRNLGVEMLEIYPPVEVTPDLENRVNEGFKSWMGSSFLSSDEEDEPDDYQVVPTLSLTNSSRQRAL